MWSCFHYLLCFLIGFIADLVGCGESRSLKNEITQLVHTSDEYGSLKLMVVYRNSEKVLAQAIGASNEITILYYHHSVPYNYRGKLRALNILSSLRPYLASPPEELPLKHLKSPESLKDFLESSDKALILFEFCGWTSTLLSELKRNVTEDNLWHGELTLDLLCLLYDLISKEFFLNS